MILNMDGVQNIFLKMEKIRFKDLSVWLKAVVVLGWVYLGLLGIGFVIGVIEGILGL